MTQHGTVRPWPDVWLPVGVLTCDWGSCYQVAAFARFDVRFGWLPVCSSCVVEVEPKEPVTSPTGFRERGTTSRLKHLSTGVPT